MENIIQIIEQLKQVFLQSNELITIFGGLIVAVIVLWKQIKNELNRKDAKADLSNIAKGLITSIELKPNDVLESLISKSSFPSKIDQDTSGQVKEEIVVQSIIERNPSLLKKAQLKDIPAIFDFVRNVYQGVKPIVKLLRKGKK